MRMISGFGCKTKKTIVCAALVAPVVSVWAQGVPIEDDDLAGVWGQAMFSVVNSDADKNGLGFDFTKITLNADVKLNANLNNIQLGKVGTTTDVDISELRFVSSGASGVDPYVKMTDPYIEFVYKNQGKTADQSQREIVGLRMGFGSIDGNIGLKINSLNGNVVLADPNPAAPTYGNLTLANTRSTDFACQSGCTTLPMSQVGSVSASGASDFYISLLSQAVTYGDGTSAPDGVSVNWTKGVTYTNTNGTILPNPLPSLQKRQGG